MPVILRMLEILALFGTLGLPVNLLLLTRIDGPPGRWRVSARLLLAPVTGLAVFTVFTGFFYATSRPIVAAVPWFWLLLGVLWLTVLLIWWCSAPRCFPFRPGWRSALSHGLVALVLVVVLAMYLQPFIKNPDLVFWHYAGSDGYMYMRMAENIASRGTGIVPTLGPYDGVSGFLAEDLRHLHEGLFTEKPGTMATLGGMAGLLGLTTHETFSPLVGAGLTMLSLVLIVFGQSLLRLPFWASLGLAALGTLAMPVWMLGTHTFFANVLAMPFYALIMVLVRPVARWRSAVYVGLLLAGQTLLFPDGELVMVGVLAVTTPFLLWTAWRRRRLRQLLNAGALTMATTWILVAPFGRVLFATTFARLLKVLSPGPKNILLHNAADNPDGGWLHLHSLATIDWVWPAFNLNTIPPQPLLAGEKPYVWGFATLLVLFVGLSLGRRRMIQLFYYLVSVVLVLVLGLAGLLKSDYELFRALAIFAFVPLAAVCVLPWLVAGHAHTWRATTLRLVLLTVLAPLLVHFVRNDLYHFGFAYEQHAADAQYTTASLRDRAEISRLGASHSMVLATETPSFTAMANVMVLLSSVRLGLPVTYQKFVFFGDVGRRDAVYEADLVVKNLRYADIVERDPHEKKLYGSADFAVVENDQVPFFDNDTLPLTNGFLIEFLHKNRLALARTLSGQTEIAFYSRNRREIVIAFQLGVRDRPDYLSYGLDQAPGEKTAVGENGWAVLPPLTVERGLHRLNLGAVDRPVQLEVMRIRESNPDASATISGPLSPSTSERALPPSPDHP